MKIKVSAKNRYDFIPDIGDNLKLPDNEKFVIVLTRLNQVLNSGKWSHFGADGSVSVNLKQKMIDHIIEFKRPPLIDDGVSQKELTVEMLLSDRYPELSDLVNQILGEINANTGRKPEIETKKS